MEKLSIALGSYPHAGGLSLPGYALEPVEVKPIISAYRRMIRDLAYDVCELAPMSYLMAVQAGIPLTAIPVFLNRRFHHGDVQCAAGSGIRVPRDLAGKRVGARAYTVSTAVWVRGILQSQYGVDPAGITWVVDDDDHIEGRTPPNVSRVTDGRSLSALLSAGDIAAALTGNAGTGRAGAPRTGWTAPASDPGEGGTYPLFPDADVLATDWYRRTGIYPLHSVVVLRSELAERDPDLPTALYAAFAARKRSMVADDPEWAGQPRFARQAAQIGGDPLPYGIAGNSPSLQAAVRFSVGQGLLDAGFPGFPFAPGDYPDA